MTIWRIFLVKGFPRYFTVFTKENPTVKFHFQMISFYAGTWNSLVKMSNSKIETWSLQVRSIVDFRAIASIPSSKLWTFFKCCLNILHLTMHLNVITDQGERIKTNLLQMESTQTYMKCYGCITRQTNNRTTE